MSSPFKLLVISVLLIFLLPVFIPWVSASSEDVAILSITQAEETLASAFEAVLDAERVGANVSGLLGRLNLGGEYLAEAYVWVRLGDSESAGRFAGLCVEVAENVRGVAVGLMDEAHGWWVLDVLQRIVWSFFGVVVVVVAGFVVWRVFRERYLERVFRLRPEVNTGES